MRIILRFRNNVITWLLYLHSANVYLMAFLKDKSDFNMAGAELLHNNNLYAPSVHCAYYSCLQLNKYIIKSFIGIDYPDQKLECEALNRRSHDYLIKKVLDEVVKVNRFEYLDLRREIYDLKAFREKSDYENELIDIVLSKKSIDTAKKIRNYLIKKMI
jgi:hypothetical protein